MLKYLLPLVLLATPALAQQQVLTPAETALQINTIVATWAQQLSQQAKVISDQQARIKELEDKAKEPAK